jgi:hypothetical protein
VAEISAPRRDPDLLRAQPEGRIAREPCDTVQIFIHSPAVGGLPEQIRLGKLCIAPGAGIHQVILNGVLSSRCVHRVREQEAGSGASDLGLGLLSTIERRKGAPTIETVFLLWERFRKSIDWILRGEGLPSTTNLSSGGSPERVIEVAHLLFPPKHTHRTRVPLISGPILQTGLSVLGRAVHKATVRILGYVHSVEGDDVTFLKVRDDHVLELSLCLHNLQPPVTAVPQLLRFEFWPVGAAAYKLTTRFVEVSRAGP